MDSDYSNSSVWSKPYEPQSDEHSKRKRNSLTLKERYEIIKLYDDNNLDLQEVTEKFACGRTQIYQIIRERDRYTRMLAAEGAEPLNENRKKMRPPKNEVINVMVYDWYKEMKTNGENVTGPMLQKKAITFTNILGMQDEFKASNGWLQSFLQRHAIRLADGRETVEVVAAPDPSPTIISGQMSKFVPIRPKPPAPVIVKPKRTPASDIFGKIKQESEVLFDFVATGAVGPDPLLVGGTSESKKPQADKNIKNSEVTAQLNKIKVVLESRGKHDMVDKLQEVCNVLETEEAFYQLEMIKKLLRSRGKMNLVNKLEEVSSELRQMIVEEES